MQGGYKIISAETSTDLEKRVTEYMENGWLPAGGIQVVQGGILGRLNYFQAMYRKVQVDPMRR